MARVAKCNSVYALCDLPAVLPLLAMRYIACPANGPNYFLIIPRETRNKIWQPTNMCINVGILNRSNEFHGSHTLIEFACHPTYSIHLQMFPTESALYINESY